ncbi:MAG: PKD domain-containing protein [Gammaproteobacteria bacterium]|nr:PKD domain-containing protein [Gammaproteobacteria bacterium]
MLRSHRMVLVICCFLTPLLAQAQSDVAREKIAIKAQNRPLASLRDAADKAKNRPVVTGKAREVVNYRGKGKPAPSGSTAQADVILQASAGDQITAVNSGFYGASNNDNAALLGTMIAPPDTDGQVGRTHYVQMINLLTTVFDKSGNIVTDGQFASNAFWDGQGGNCEAYNQGDPIVLYDDVADRWLVSQFAFPDSMGSYSQCVAVSTGGDPMGGWNRYEFPFEAYGLNDYPKHGIVSDSITMMANLFSKRGRNFNWAGTFLGVMDKAAMYAGASEASLIGFNIGTNEWGFIAGDLDGPSGVDVPAVFATAMTNVNSFDIWHVDVDWATENANAYRVAAVPVTPFDSEICTASRGACIPQPEGGPLLESLSDRLMHRLQIRDFGAYRSMVTTHTVDVGSGRAGIRWYELRETTGSNWTLHQEGTFGPADGEHRFMPSAAMNAAGDIGIGYLLSSDVTYVSTAVAGQTAAASGSGLLNSEEIICAVGTGVQLDVARSGDYSSTSVDPIDDSFWHTNEVFTQTGGYQWNTYVCEFVVADSGGGNIPPAAGFSFSCDELACAFTDNSTDSDGSIASWDWTFGDGDSSTAENPGHIYAGDGDYTVTLLVTDNEGATDTDAQTVSVTGPVANVPPTADFSFTCTELTCQFTDLSVDSGDGSVVYWHWTFGEGGNSSTAVDPSYTYAVDGDYIVTLLVTDNEGATDSVAQTVTVSADSGEPDLLDGAVWLNKNRWEATVVDLNGGDLQGTWSGSGTVVPCANSVCKLTNIHKRITSVTFSADGSAAQITVDQPPIE